MTAASQTSIKYKLFIMMILQIAIWGAWFPLIFGYLPSMGFSAGQQTWILNTFPIAAIVGMFFSNQFADRSFAAEKFLAVSHLIGGLAMIGLAFIKAPEPVAGLAAGAANPNAPFWPFFLLMFVHCLLYVPTISITNSIAFSPTDAMPLSHRAKLLMLSESAISVVTVLLVAARAVNIVK